MSALSYLAGVLCIGAVLLARLPTLEHRQIGLPVLVGGRCPSDMSDNNRIVVLRYLSGGRLMLNDRALDESTLRRSISEAMQFRAERLLWIAADERVSYEEVIDIISKLKSDVPDLNIAIATKAQIGPVGPTEIASMKARHVYDQTFGEMPCVIAGIDHHLS